MPHHGVGLAERQAALGQVVGHVGCGKVPHPALAHHGVGVDRHGLDHARHDGEALAERLGGVERALLVLLQILVVGERQTLHGHEQLHEIAVHAAALSADELGKVGILLLRHDRGAGGIAIGERDEPELGAAPEHDLLGEAREMHGHNGAGVVQVEQEVAIRHGIERIGDHVGEPELGGRHLAIERIGGAGERGGTERAGIGGLKGGGKAAEIAREHPHVGEQVVREEHRLGMLQVRVARQDHAGVLLGGGHERAAQLEVSAHELLGERLYRQTRVGRHLVVARAARVQALSGLADTARELALDGHVDVLVVDVEGEVAGVDIGLDGIETRADLLGVLGADDALSGEHARMGL